MATCNQRYQIAAQRKKDNARTRGLEQRPHARGWVNRVTIVTPRKPNSAKRPVVKVFLRRGGRLTAHIPGIGHSLKKFSKILLRGRGPRDLPGVRYSGVRGVLDFLGLKKKKRRRSIYGAEQNNISKIRARRKYRVAIRVAERENNRKKENETLLEEESNINVAIQNFLLKNKFKKTSIYVNKQYSSFFFKNPIFAIKNRASYIYRDTLLKIYNDFLNIFNLYSVFSFFFIFMFNKNLFYSNKLYLKDVLFFKITWPSYFVKRTPIISFNFLRLNNYLLFYFKLSFRFFLYNENYKVITNLFLPPKRHIRKVLIRKQFFFFLISITEKKVSSICLKKIKSKEKIMLQDYETFTNLNFFFYKNNKVLFKNISRVYFKSNLQSFYNVLTKADNILLNSNLTSKKFCLAKRLLYINNHAIKRSLNLKFVFLKKKKINYL